MNCPIEPPLRLKVIQFESLQEYKSSLQKMRDFTLNRSKSDLDEIWLMQHQAVYTLGIRERDEDIIDTGDIPVVKSDRGGLITYHGAGQLMVYLLLDIRRLGIGLKSLVNTLEQTTIDLLASYGINAGRLENAPGVYVSGQKIASIGLRVRHGCTYHGLSLNVDMDLSPFERIVPCGLTGMKMTDMKRLSDNVDITTISRQFVHELSSQLGYNPHYEY